MPSHSPDYADEVALVRSQRALLAETTNSFILNLQVWVTLIGSAALLYQLHPALVLVPLFGLGSLWTGRRANAIIQVRDEANAERQRAKGHVRTLGTTAGPAKELRVFGLADEMIRRYRALAETILRESTRASWKHAGYEILGSLFFAVGYIGSLALVLVRAVQGLLTPGDVVLAAGLAAQLNGTIASVVDMGNYLGRAAKAASRYVWLADYAAARRPRADPAPVPERLARGISLEGLHFRYPGTETIALDDVSLHLPAGSVVAIVGENGAGKTTLVKLLSRFYEPDAGRIVVDGIDLGRFDVDEWRERITAGYQDFCRFELLAGQTIGVGDLPRLADPAALARALDRAIAQDVIAQLPRGLETQLGKSWDGGVELSGGQWQKLALARALMRRQPLVVAFDEPTAALDAQTEHALFERFAAAARTGAGRGSITILVSHRFSTVRMADLIVVLDKGKIAEIGTHAELMARRGLYAELYSLQAAAYT